MHAECADEKCFRTYPVCRNDEPIAGATVLVKGTSIGVASDAHGHFTLKVPESATELIVSFMGMETQEVGIKANLTIRLKSANEKLDEVMVVAYGTAKNRALQVLQR